ncbi:hypothetical protein [Microcella sp.]|uniref:hypothetical protein n=1 Tax=Microcella sp. TaxID=1913979 RepID=UPI00299F64A1|nr:hypothetical protein [Microcella sp.]MDX2026087.1 hypothetical protein [Microcella sp.]
MSRRHALVVLPLVVLFAALVGCTGATRIPPPEPSTAVEPLFASDEEALEAATEAYEEYLAVLDGLLQAPLEVDGAFDSVASGQALQLAEESVQKFLDDVVRISGPRVVGSVELQQLIVDEEATEVILYVCEDLSGIVLLDSGGNSLTTPDRPNYSIFQIVVSFGHDGGRVVDRQFWSNETSC